MLIRRVGERGKSIVPLAPNQRQLHHLLLQIICSTARPRDPVCATAATVPRHTAWPYGPTPPWRRSTGREGGAEGKREGALGERERKRVSLRLLLFNLNDYIAFLFIVLSRLVS